MFESMALLSEERIQPSKNDLVFLTQKKIYNFAKKYSKSLVLDIASGIGYGAKILSKNAKKVMGVDIDKKTVYLANKRYGSNNVEFIWGDAQKIPLSKKSVDNAVTIETIEHLKNPKKFVKELYRVLKPKGFVILSTPNGEYKEEKGQFHEKEYSLKELESILKPQFKIMKELGVRWSDRVEKRNKEMKDKRKKKLFNLLIRIFQSFNHYMPLQVKKNIYSIFVGKKIILYDENKDILIEKFNSKKHHTILLILVRK